MAKRELAIATAARFFSNTLPMDTTALPTPYLLLFRNSGPETHANLSADERQALIDQWNAWYEALAVAGKALDGRPLSSETRVVSGTGGSRVIDGPFAEAKEAIGGYILLMVSDREEATEIARQHPGLAYGLQIEVRQMAEHCHLGIGPKSKTPKAV